MTDNRGDSPTSTTTSRGAGGRLGGATAAVRERASSAAARVSGAYDSARMRAGHAYQGARQSAADGLDGNPLAVLAGGLAIGAIAGALLPRTRKEEELLGGVGRQLNETAREAARAAREAGTQQLGLSRDAARSQVQSLLDKATQAAKTAGEAAAQSVRSRAKTGPR